MFVFQSLQELKVEIKRDFVSDAALPENAKKNKSQDILPGQMFTTVNTILQ